MMAMSCKTVFLTFCFLLCFTGYMQVVSSLQEFVRRIPNGLSVPNPGPQRGVWAAVGHVNAGGGGGRNPFGEDFAKEGFRWTSLLCNTDSDGDGRSNGVELGDPSCEWFVGGPDPKEPALSHPGIVDEPDEDAAKDSCSDYIEPTQVINVDMSFTHANTMDANQTHYICEQKYVDVSHIDLVHMVKSSILLDNQDVLHHMLIYACEEEPAEGYKVGEGQYECRGTDVTCTRIAGWAIGSEESCQPQNVGAEFDLRGVNQLLIKIEAHYDNTSGEPQQDQSGMRLVMTPELRPLKAGSSILGMTPFDHDFEIPINVSNYPLTNICPTEATMKMDQPIFVYQFAPHMHLSGRSQYTEHYRCGEKIGEIGRIDSFEFDNQQRYSLLKPVKVLPGDALVTTCAYDNLNSDQAITGGDETADEMCFNFLSYYPKQSALENCFSFENGLTLDENEGSIDFRFAIGGSGSADVILNFDSDPTKNLADCCATNSCEEMYIGDLNDACASHVDCVDGLECIQGLCAPAPLTPSPTLIQASSAAAFQSYQNLSCLLSAVPMISLSAILLLLL